MARYDKEHKRLSRQRIIETAGRRFKADGIAASGVATLMKDAGLTNGAFYGHFDSKEELVGITLGEELRRQRATLGALAPGFAGLEQFVHAYLSVEHRDDLSGGCASAALLDEIGRSADGTRQSYSEGMVSIIDDLADRLVGVDHVQARSIVLSVFALMVGTIQLSRALTDREMADAVLAQGAKNALMLIRAAAAPPRNA